MGQNRLSALRFTCGGRGSWTCGLGRACEKLIGSRRGLSPSNRSLESRRSDRGKNLFNALWSDDLRRLNQVIAVYAQLKKTVIECDLDVEMMNEGN